VSLRAFELRENMPTDFASPFPELGCVAVDALACCGLEGGCEVYLHTLCMRQVDVCLYTWRGLESCVRCTGAEVGRVRR
jgi:hypothetical protein